MYACIMGDSTDVAEVCVRLSLSVCVCVWCPQYAFTELRAFPRSRIESKRDRHAEVVRQELRAVEAQRALLVDEVRAENAAARAARAAPATAGVSAHATMAATGDAGKPRASQGSMSSTTSTLRGGDNMAASTDAVRIPGSAPPPAAVASTMSMPLGSNLSLPSPSGSFPDPTGLPQASPAVAAALPRHGPLSPSSLMEDDEDNDEEDDGPRHDPSRGEAEEEKARGTARSEDAGQGSASASASASASVTSLDAVGALSSGVLSGGGRSPSLWPAPVAAMPAVAVAADDGLFAASLGSPMAWPSAILGLSRSSSAAPADRALATPTPATPAPASLSAVPAVAAGGGLDVARVSPARTSSTRSWGAAAAAAAKERDPELGGWDAAPQATGQR
jgi:hypothetical protein